MRINEIIREKRREQGLTQEQAAHRLGVTASAVNKWERGVSQTLRHAARAYANKNIKSPHNIHWSLILC